MPSKSGEKELRESFFDRWKKLLGQHLSDFQEIIATAGVLGTVAASIAILANDPNISIGVITGLAGNFISNAVERWRNAKNDSYPDENIQWLISEIENHKDDQSLKSTLVEIDLIEQAYKSLDIKIEHLERLVSLGFGTPDQLIKISTGGGPYIGNDANVGRDIVTNIYYSPPLFEKELTKSSDTPSLKVLHNLPQPDYGQFVGRNAEIKRIIEILRPYPYSQHALVTIDGIGGIGKTALALEVAHRYLRPENLSHEEQFEAIVWTSAKLSRLTVDGILPRQKNQRTLESILSTIVSVFQDTNPSNLSLDFMTRLLTQHRTLLIVDNLETIDDHAVNEFLRELPAPTKAIVTTRHRLDVAYPIRLVGMPEKDALKLILYECQKKLVSLRETDIQQLYKRTSGVPLAIVWSIAQIAFGFPVDNVLKRLGRPNDDISRFCFDEALSHIRNTKAYDLLMAICLSESGGTRTELGYVTGLDENILDRDENLVQLQKLSLIQQIDNKFDVLPLVRHFVLEDIKLNSQSQLEDRIVAKWGILFAIPQAYNSIFIDKSTRTVWVEGEIVSPLTPQLFQILSYLYDNQGRICTYESIINTIWPSDDMDAYDRTSSLSTHMSRLKRILGHTKNGDYYIHAVHSRGFMLKL